METSSSLLVVGLAGTGKTTFLAALWHVAESQEVDGALQLVKISDEAKHLNSVKNDWLLFRSVVRSILAPSAPVSLWLKEHNGNTQGEVVFPDPSGEMFGDQWKNRQWTSEYDRLVQTADSVLLFVNPCRVKEPYTIAEMQRLAEAAFPEEGELPAPEPETTLAPEQVNTDLVGTEQWTPELAPTQVQMVGLLQFLEPHFAVRQPVRLALIVSAWDQIAQAASAHLSPTTWVCERLPYLDQYLRSHHELFTVQVYGVSAQGGDLERDHERLKSIDPASHRIIIEGPDCAKHDITEPVRWALGWRA
jgi:hypothetical protein